MQNITEKMGRYTSQYLGVSSETAFGLYKRHGTTLRGLQEEGHITPDKVEDMLAFCHDIDRSDILPNPEVAGMVARLTGADKWAFTASIREHAADCLARVGVDQHLTNPIIDVRAVGFYTKHHPEAYHTAMKLADISPEDVGACVFLDDSASNIKVAKQVGWITILVTGTHGRDKLPYSKPVMCEAADYIVESVLELEEIFPHLFSDS